MSEPGHNGESLGGAPPVEDADLPVLAWHLRFTLRGLFCTVTLIAVVLAIARVIDARLFLGVLVVPLIALYVAAPFVFLMIVSGLRRVDGRRIVRWAACSAVTLLALPLGAYLAWLGPVQFHLYAPSFVGVMLVIWGPQAVLIWFVFLVSRVPDRGRATRRHALPQRLADPDEEV